MSVPKQKGNNVHDIRTGFPIRSISLVRTLPDYDGLNSSAGISIISGLNIQEANEKFGEKNFCHSEKYLTDHVDHVEGVDSFARILCLYDGRIIGLSIILPVDSSHDETKIDEAKKKIVSAFDENEILNVRDIHLNRKKMMSEEMGWSIEDIELFFIGDPFEVIATMLYIELNRSRHLENIFDTMPV